MSITNILVVEDDELLASKMKEGLQEKGYHVTLTARGAAGLKALADDPDLVILDESLPDMDAADFVLACRSDPSRNRPALLWLNSHPSDADRVRTILTSSAMAYVTKPFSMLEVYFLVDRLLTYLQSL